MKTVLLYATSHGCTRKVVERSLPKLNVKPDVFNVKDGPTLEQLAAYDILLFFSPTYGDRELQPDMEEFIRRISLNLTNRRFTICELGSYFGYDAYSFGTKGILRQCLFELGAKEFCQPLSLDSLPRVDWAHLHRWIEEVNRCFNAYVRY